MNQLNLLMNSSPARAKNLQIIIRAMTSLGRFFTNNKNAASRHDLGHTISEIFSGTPFIC